MKALKMGAIMLSAILLVGCSSNNSQAEYDSLMAEKQSLEAELEKQKETATQETTESTEQASDAEIIFDKTYNIGDEDTMRFAMLNKEGQTSLSVFGEACNADNATIMFLASAGVLQNGDLDFSVHLSCGELYMLYSVTDGKLSRIGTNTDGSTTFATPDWIKANIDLTTETNSQYYLEALEAVQQFTQDFINEYEIETSSDASENQTDSQTKDIEVLAEYTLPDGIGWYTRHFVVVRNNSDKTLEISTSSKAYDSDGNVLALAGNEVEALGAGCTTVFYEAFETESAISSYDMNITYKVPTRFKSVNQDLSYNESVISNGAIYDVTNNGDEAAKFVEGYALFFRGDTLVGYDSNYITDDDSEIKSGETISQQFKCYESFDRIEFYLNGRK